MMCEAHILAMIDTLKEMAEDTRKFESKRLMNDAAGVRVRNHIEPLRKQLKVLRRLMLVVRRDRIDRGVRTK